MVSVRCYAWCTVSSGCVLVVVIVSVNVFVHAAFVVVVVLMTSGNRNQSISLSPNSVSRAWSSSSSISFISISWKRVSSSKESFELFSYDCNGEAVVDKIDFSDKPVPLIWKNLKVLNSLLFLLHLL